MFVGWSIYFYWQKVPIETCCASQRVPKLDLSILIYLKLIFLQHNASCHTSNTTKMWFNDNTIPLFECPHQTHNMTIMKNAWRAAVHLYNLCKYRATFMHYRFWETYLESLGSNIHILFIETCSKHVLSYDWVSPK